VAAELIVLRDGLERLRDAFNNDASSVRMLILTSPT